MNKSLPSLPAPQHCYANSVAHQFRAVERRLRISPASHEREKTKARRHCMQLCASQTAAPSDWRRKRRCCICECFFLKLRCARLSIPNQWHSTSRCCRIHHLLRIPLLAEKTVTHISGQIKSKVFNSIRQGEKRTAIQPSGFKATRTFPLPLYEIGEPKYV